MAGTHAAACDPEDQGHTRGRQSEQEGHWISNNSLPCQVGGARVLTLGHGDGFQSS